MQAERVYWTDDDKQEISQAVAKRFLNNPTKSLLEHLQGYIAQMPKHKQRSIATYQAVPWLLENITKEYKLIGERLNKIDTLERELREAKEWTATVENNNHELQEDIRRLRLSQQTTDVVGSLDEASTAQLADALLQRLSTALSGKMLSIMDLIDRLSDMSAPQMHTSVSQPTKPKQQKLPVVVIAGLLDTQFATVHKKVANYAVCKHIGSGKSTLPQSSYPAANLAFIATSFTDHSTQNNFKSFYGGENVFLVGGSVSAMVNRIISETTKFRLKSTKA